MDYRQAKRRHVTVIVIIENYRKTKIQHLKHLSLSISKKITDTFTDS